MCPSPRSNTVRAIPSPSRVTVYPTPATLLVVSGAVSSRRHSRSGPSPVSRTAVSFASLFKPDTRPLDVIFPIVQSEVSRQLGVDSPITATDGLDPAKYSEFALTDDSIIFFFGQGEVMAGAGGALQATVPRSAVASMLA